MVPRSLNLVDLHRKFYKLPWLACGRYKLVRQSVEMTLHPPPPEEFPEDGPGATVLASQAVDTLIAEPDFPSRRK